MAWIVGTLPNKSAAEHKGILQRFSKDGCKSVNAVVEDLHWGTLSCKGDH